MKNKIMISFGMILHIQAIISAYSDRGDFRIGGEWLVFPFLYLAYNAFTAFLRENMLELLENLHFTRSKARTILAMSKRCSTPKYNISKTSYAIHTKMLA